MAAYNPNSRVQVVDAPVSHPGYCALCGSVGGDGRKFIDTGWAPEEFYGVVYYCSFCFAEIANQVGFLTTDQVQDLQRRFDETEKTLKATLDECSNLRLAVDALTASGYVVPDGDEDGMEGDSESSDGEQGTSESSSESGSGNVPSSSELDDLSEFGL